MLVWVSITRVEPRSGSLDPMTHPVYIALLPTIYILDGGDPRWNLRSPGTAAADDGVSDGADLAVGLFDEWSGFNGERVSEGCDKGAGFGDGELPCGAWFWNSGGVRDGDGGCSFGDGGVMEEPWGLRFWQRC
ncbi:hypothetical protein V6N11_055908 [Hibiscus sabdariffa]|uniref:Uncharacterized protein n=1 Tax=Hibiscus sabdariffa TaxID=183260 RepID=A0ABR2T334_9ROSI